MRNSLQQVSLVDQVENAILKYATTKGLSPGDSLPTLQELTDTLGVGVSVVREAISRLRMLGLIESRPHRGMILKEPPLFMGLKRVIDPSVLGEEVMFNILGFRLSLEVGMAELIFKKIKPEDISELEEILSRANGNDYNDYTVEHDYEFHKKLYQITGNPIVIEFQEIIYPIFVFLKNKYRNNIIENNIKLRKEGKLVSHKYLVDCIKNGDKEAFLKGMARQFESYGDLLK